MENAFSFVSLCTSIGDITNFTVKLKLIDDFQSNNLLFLINSLVFLVYKKSENNGKWHYLIPEPELMSLPCMF